MGLILSTLTHFPKTTKVYNIQLRSATDATKRPTAALQDFFGHLPDLLAGPESRFSFFNGLGATSTQAAFPLHYSPHVGCSDALFYDVYTHLSELHLADVGIDIQWADVDVIASGNADRWGQTKEYFALPTYRLPIGRMREI